MALAVAPYRAFLSRAPAWILPGAALDFDFQNSRYFQQGIGNSINALITTSRASTGYADDTPGNWTSFANNVARITNKGLLVEEARTNSIRNNSMQDAVAGTPGTLPTNWVYITAGGLTSTIVAVGTANGVDYIDLKWAGTTTTTATRLATDAATQIAAVVGQAWAPSLFYALVGGSLTNISSIGNEFIVRNAGGTILSVVGNLFTPTATLQRNTPNATTIADATAAFVQQDIRLNHSIGVAVDITLRIGWPQLELGAFATSPIRTTSAAVTRAADVVTVTSPPVFGSAYTLFGKGAPNAPVGYGSNQTILQIDDGSNDNRSRIRRGSQATSLVQGIVVANTVATAITGLQWNALLSQKVTLAKSNGNQGFAVNGTLIGTAAGDVPVGQIFVRIGAELTGTYWSGYIERIALWPTTRLPNADLERITTL